MVSNIKTEFYKWSFNWFGEEKKYIFQWEKEA